MINLIWQKDIICEGKERYLKHPTKNDVECYTKNELSYKDEKKKFVRTRGVVSYYSLGQAWIIPMDLTPILFDTTACRGSGAIASFE
jgi:hypothetical protein